jgi:NAD(P)-dependent dehydrogenase (short-subunit alcohol dehydrogenase family)
MKLKGKVAIVTGASRGLGKAIANGLAKEGVAVTIAARTEKESKELPGTIYRTAEEIELLGGRSLPLKCDMTQEEEVQQMVLRTLAEFGQIDILVNNAGIAFPSPLWEMPLKRWELVLRVNLTGTFLCTKAVLPFMMEKRKGSIINISSIQATSRVIRAARTGIAYGVSKAAIERFTWGIAAEVGKFNIAVNCVKPRGAVRTEGMEFLNPDSDASHWDTPEMMVRAVTFLAGQDASGVSGSVATDEEICAWHGLL